MYDCIIIGGGISGISFAHHIRQRDEKILILEQEERLGGRICTATTATDDFRVELGAHTCYNSYTSVIRMITSAGLRENILPMASLPYKLYDNRKLKSLLSGISVFSLLANGWKIFGADKKGKTTRQYFSPIVGEENYNRLFSKAFRAVISQEADSYPAEIFLKRRQQKDKTIARRFTYAGGLQQMLQDVATAGGAEVLTGESVISIQRSEGGIFELRTKSGKVLNTRNISIATDLQTASRLLQNVATADVVQALANIQLSRSVAIAVEMDKKHLNIKPMAGIIPLCNRFYSAVSRDTITHNTQRAFTFHFPESPISVAERTDTILKVLNTNPKATFRTYVCKHTLPMMQLSDLHLATRLQASLQHSGIYLIGNYFEGMSLEDCVLRSQAEAERYRAEN